MGPERNKSLEVNTASIMLQMGEIMIFVATNNIWNSQQEEFLETSYCGYEERVDGCSIYQQLPATTSINNSANQQPPARGIDQLLTKHE